MNPCDDFYEFVCGNYGNTVEIAPDSVTASVIKRYVDQIKDILRKQLNEPISACDPTPVRYASEMFKGCTDASEL